MTEVGWTRDELDRMRFADELRIAPLSGGGAVGRSVPIWVVRIGEDLYVRSWRGARGAWFRAARASRAAHIGAGGVERDVEILDAGERSSDAVDAAYRRKYGRYPTYVEPPVSPAARATTLRLIPRDADAERT
jgi:hypothetical protein